jgi:hypothetical protein
LNTKILRAVVGGLVIGVTPASGQVTVQTDFGQATIGGYLQVQFNTSSVDGARSSDFLIRRARLGAQVEINDFLTVRFLPDFGAGSARISDAYARLNFSESFRVTMGQFKRPFDLFQLVSSSQILVVERTGVIRGLDDCPGLGGICSFSSFSVALGLSDRDIGVMVDGTGGSGRVSYAVSVTNGNGANALDENGSKSVSGRVRVEAAPNVRIGGNIALHDYVNTATVEDEYAMAIGADVEFGSYDGGWHGVAGLMVGDNWLDLDAGGDPSTFVTAQGILTYRAPVEGNEYVRAIEPIGRLSFGNPNTDVASDGGVLLTPGMVLHFIGRNKIEANVDVWLPDTGDTAWSLKMQTQLYF